MGFEIGDLRGIGADFTGQMVVYLAGGDNPITEAEWATYTPDPGFILNTPRQPKFDMLNVLGSPYQPSGVYTYFTDTSGFTWQAVAAVENRIYPFEPADYSGYQPPLTNSAQAGYTVLTPLPGTIQYNNNDKNHDNIYYAKDSSGKPQIQYFVTDPWGNVYILKSLNLANDTPEEIAAAVASAVLPEGWTKSSGYLDEDTIYSPVWSGSVAHANEFRDSADSAWMQIKWGKSGITLAAEIGEGLEIWGGNTDDAVKGTTAADVMHGGDGDDRVHGRKGADSMTGDAGDDKLRGGDGVDDLSGGGGGDYLVGRNGADLLLGGAGDDDLKGGAGHDTFRYDDVVSGIDTVLDFQPGTDRIDLSAIDANAATAKDDAFVLVGPRFSGQPGEVRIVTPGGDSVIKADVDGDRRADFAIHVLEVALFEKGDLVL